MNSSKVSRAKGLVFTTLMVASVSFGVIGCSGDSETSPSADQTTEIESGPSEEFRLNLIADSLTEQEAGARVEQAGFTWRVGEIDGEPQAVTMDYREDRLTFTVENGIVTDASWG